MLRHYLDIVTTPSHLQNYTALYMIRAHHKQLCSLREKCALQSLTSYAALCRVQIKHQREKLN